MATNKKSTPEKTTAAPAGADSATAAAVAPAAKPAAPKAAAPKASTPKAAAPKRIPAKAAGKPGKAVDPAVQASKAALAKALAAAQAVKIEKPLGKPKAEKAEKEVKEAKAPKARKAKLVRDSFTMPENEYAHLSELKKRLLDRGVVAKKSELLRAGVALLVGLGDAELAATMAKVEVIKTGRPAKSGK